jgi:ABC-2 type transport system permease protein
LLKAELIKNEIAKITGRTSSWIMLGMLPLMTTAAAVLASREIDQELQSGQVWEFMRLGLMAMPNLADFAALFTILAAAGSVASEFSSGTIKLLLIRPYSRAEILLSKYVAVQMYGLVMLLTVLLSTFTAGALLLGLDGANQIYHGGVSRVELVLRSAGANFVELFVLSTLAFMFSTVLRSNATAIGISVLLLLAGPQFAYMVQDYSWSSYTLFANTDLIAYTLDQPYKDGMTIGFSLSVLAAHVIVFVLLAWGVFQRRDVAG